MAIDINSVLQRAGLTNNSMEDIDDFASNLFGEQARDAIINNSMPQGGMAALNNRGRDIQEVLNVVSKSRAKTPYCIQTTDVDNALYDLLYDNSPVIQDRVQQNSAILPSYPTLSTDIFNSLFKFNPVANNINHVAESSYVNYSLLTQMMASEEFTKLQQTCKGNFYCAALGTELLSQQVTEQLEKLKDQYRPLFDKMARQLYIDKNLKQAEEILFEDMANALDFDKDDLIDMFDSGGLANLDFGTQELLLDYSGTPQFADAQTLMQQMQQQAPQFDMGDIQQMQNLGQQMQQFVDSATAFVVDQVEESSSLMKAWGMGDGETVSGVRVPYEKKKAFLAAVRKSKKLKQISDMIGQFKESAMNEQKKKTDGAAVELKSVTNQGNNKIENVLPSELMYLLDDRTKGFFYKKMTENSLLVYEKENTSSKNRGPMVVCVDTSGSMSGDREIWSKCIALSLLEVAQMQKRNFAYIQFSDDARKPIIIEKDELDVDKIKRIAEDFDSGGTDFEPPLKRAAEVLDMSQFKNGDIVFITDGECDIGDDFRRKFNATKECKDFKCRGIIVGNTNTRSTKMNRFCDSVECIRDVSTDGSYDSEVVKQLFGSV